MFKKRIFEHHWLLYNINWIAGKLMHYKSTDIVSIYDKNFEWFVGYRRILFAINVLYTIQLYTTLITPDLILQKW